MLAGNGTGLLRLYFFLNFRPVQFHAEASLGIWNPHTVSKRGFTVPIRPASEETGVCGETPCQSQLDRALQGLLPRGSGHLITYGS